MKAINLEVAHMDRAKVHETTASFLNILNSTIQVAGCFTVAH
jgi:hypothetical protein